MRQHPNIAKARTSTVLSVTSERRNDPDDPDGQVDLIATPRILDHPAGRRHLWDLYDEDPAVDPGGTSTKVWYPACRLPSGTYPDLPPPVLHLARFVTGTMKRAQWTRMHLPAHVWKIKLGSIKVTYSAPAQVAGDGGPRTRGYLGEFGGVTRGAEYPSTRAPTMAISARRRPWCIWHLH